MIAYAGNTFRNVDGGQATATIESLIIYAGNTFRNDCILATHNKCIVIFTYDCITIVSRIINRVSLFHIYFFKPTATSESNPANAGNTFRDVDGSQATAT